MLTFYLTRHGETEWNRAKKTMGHLDSPLTPEGREGDERSARKMHDIDVDAICSSDLGRAYSKAEIIADVLGIPREEILKMTSLREINYGELQGKEKEVTKREYPKYKSPEHFGHVFKGGESFQQMHARVLGAIEELDSDYDGKSVVIVSHNNPCRAIICHYMGEDLAEHLFMKVPHERILKFKVDKGRLISCEDVLSATETVKLRFEGGQLVPCEKSDLKEDRPPTGLLKLTEVPETPSKTKPNAGEGVEKMSITPPQKEETPPVNQLRPETDKTIEKTKKRAT